jgi:putative autoinducer-2 (AI-2) aldolase
VPVIIAGGKKLPEKDALNLTFNAIRDGASGVDMGRNIWQSDHPIEMIQAVRAIVHDGLSVENSFNSFFLDKGLRSNELETLNTR